MLPEPRVAARRLLISYRCLVQAQASVLPFIEGVAAEDNGSRNITYRGDCTTCLNTTFDCDRSRGRRRKNLDALILECFRVLESLS